MPDGVSSAPGLRAAEQGRGPTDFPRTPPAWPAAAPVLVALEKRDQAAFRAAMGQVATQVLPLAAAAPTASALYLYDLLRTVLEGLRPGRGALPEGDRLSLVALLGAQSEPSTLIGAFLGEADRVAGLFSPGRPSQHPVAQRARRFIDAHAGERVSLARVARELGVTRTYLSALFRRECGVTLTEYIHHVRIERAEALLRQGGLSMAAVAALSGYGSYRHFHRSFLKLRQVSPRAYLRGIDAAPHPASPGPGGAGTGGVPTTTWGAEPVPTAAIPPGP